MSPLLRYPVTTMSDEVLNCPKCKGEMTHGFFLDSTYGGTLVEKWHEGAPQKSFWLGTKAPGDEGIPAAAFRCSTCGYLEFYARPEFAAK